MSTSKGEIRVGSLVWVDDLNPNVTQRVRSVAAIVKSISGELAVVESKSMVWTEPLAALRPNSKDLYVRLGVGR